MSFIANKSYVALIELKDNTYYVTSRPDVTLDGITYQNVVTAWGEASFYSDAEEGFQTGSFDMRLVNGEKYLGAGYNFDPTEVWNNNKITVKLYTDGDVLFSQCLPITKGKIKEYEVNNDVISFSVEQTDEKDDQLLPPILCENQTALTDGVSKFTVTEWSSNSIKVTSYAATQLNNGEMVLLYHSNGTVQYVRITEITVNGYMYFYEAIASIYTVITVEKAFRYIPDKSIDKTIPMQFGDLNDKSNGKFAKTVTINNKVGQQIILADYISLNNTYSIGVWEKGLERYFEGKGGTFSTGDEYVISSNQNEIIFTVGTSTTLTTTTTETEGVERIYVQQPSSIPWVDSGDIDITINSELITNNVLKIDDELFLMLSKPDSTDVVKWILVERGYENSPVSIHEAGTQVFMCNKYSVKNILTFTELFFPKAVTSVYSINWALEKGVSDTVDGLGNKLENITKNDSSTVILRMDYDHNNYDGDMLFNFTMLFEKIESDISVINTYIALDANFDYKIIANSPQVNNYFVLQIESPDVQTDYDDFGPQAATHTTVLQLYRTTGDRNIEHIDTVSNIERTYLTLNSFGAEKDILDPDLSQNNASIASGNGFNIRTLKGLNKRWRVYLTQNLYPAGRVNGDFMIATISKLGLWIDCFVNFVKFPVVAPLEGRKITTDTASITQSQEGSLCEYVPDVLAQLLTQELHYIPSDFTTGWQTGLLNFSNWTQWPTEEDHPWISMAYNSTWIIAISSDGYSMRALTASPTNWSTTPSQISATTGWTAIAANEDRFVAVGSNGATQMIAGTVDGISWESGTSEGGEYGFQDITYGAGKFVAVGYEGVGAGIGIVSYDDDTIDAWSPIVLAQTNRMSSIAYSTDGNIWFAVSIDGVYTIQTSGSGILFSIDTRFSNYSWKKVRYVNDRFIFLPNTRFSNKIVVSGDNSGASLVEVDLAINGDFCTSPIDVTFGGGAYVITNQTYNSIVGSDNMASATVVVLWGGIAYSSPDNRYVAVKLSGTLTNGIAYSTNGQSWTEITAPITQGNYTGICYSSTLDLFVTCNSGERIAYSNDGIGWTSVDNGVADNVITNGNDVCCGSAGLIVVGSGTTNERSILYSSNGTSWSESTLVQNGEPWQACCYSERLSIFVVIGNLGYGVYSSNGTSWLQFPIPNYTWSKVIYAEAKEIFIAVGVSGIMRSVDGFNWQSSTDGVTLGDYYDVHYSDGIGIFWVTALLGYAHSFDGITWYETASSRGYESVTSNDVDQFVHLVGRWSNVIFFSAPFTYDLQISQNLVDWTLNTTIPQHLWGPIMYNDDVFLTVNSDTTDADPEQVMTNTFFRGKCAFSYGGDDDRMKGFEFVTKLANHYNYMINKDYEGKLDIVNASWLFTETGTGNEIRVEDILFLNYSGERRITMYQTGNDMIYNDFIIKYNRNNGTNEFQSVYTLSGSYTLANSGITLDTARTDYYQGEKRTMEIESEFIYEVEYAENLAEHKANMYAEVHILIELFIDYDHYTEINNLDDQYKLGDIIYLTGNDSGIAYDSDRKFYIKNIIISDSGRELNLHLFSVDPVTEFSVS